MWVGLCHRVRPASVQICSIYLKTMLTRYISAAIYNQRSLVITSIRLLNTSAPRLSDNDHTQSKAKEKASDDLKTGREKRWLDTVASDSGKRF